MSRLEYINTKLHDLSDGDDQYCERISVREAASLDILARTYGDSWQLPSASKDLI